MRVVQAHLARIYGYKFLGIRANHINMAKFANEKSPGFHYLRTELQRWIKKASRPTTRDSTKGRSEPEQARAIEPVVSKWGSTPVQAIGYPIQAIQPPSEAEPDPSSFSVAIFCALTVEADAVQKQFEPHSARWNYEHIRETIDSTDKNAYSFGRIGNHNVVLVHLGGKGKISTAPAARSCRSSFPNAKLFLVVGVCGAVRQSSRSRRIALGDVIISNGVVEYDLNRQYDKHYVIKDEAKHRLHIDLEGTVDKFQTDKGTRDLEETTAANLEGLLTNKPSSDDQSHPSPHVHVGWVASGNSVFLSKDKCDEVIQACDQVIGFEMEGAAVWRQGRACLVVKGVSDHADIKKTKDWQPYASAAAAACVKAILGYWKSRQGAYPLA